LTRARSSAAGPPTARSGRPDLADVELVAHGTTVYQGSTKQRYRFPYEFGGTMSAISASRARQILFPLIKQVNEDHAPVEIVSKHGNAVLVSKEDWDSIEETAYLLRSPANAARLVEATAQATRGEVVERELDQTT